MDIHEARNLFKAIASELLVFTRKNYEATNLTWSFQSERVGHLIELLEKRKWSNGYYTYSATAWELSSDYSEKHRRTSRYITEKCQYIHQEYYWPEGGNIDDTQIDTSLIDITCDSIETLSVACEELLAYALVFGLDSEKFEIWYGQLGEPMPILQQWVIR